MKNIEYSKQIGERLSRVRTMLGYKKQEDFANEFNIKTRTYAGYERGERGISLEFLNKLCTLKNVNLNYLVSGDGELFINERF